MADHLQVREVEAKSILNRSGICDFSLNCYLGCQHGCRYCYARFMLRFCPHQEEWGKFVDVKVNAPILLERQARRAPRGRVFVSSVCDPYQPLESRYGLTRSCLEILIRYNYPISILTKSSLAARDLDLLARGSELELGVTITTAEEGLRRLLEPGASPTGERLALLEQARGKGIGVYAFLGPFLPGLSDTAENLSYLVRQLARIGADYLYVDILNPRPRVWASLQPWLATHFPEVIGPTRRILYDARQRRLYQQAIRARIREAAHRSSFQGQIHFCF